MTDEQYAAFKWLDRNFFLMKNISILEERRERMESSINKAVGSYEVSEIQFDSNPHLREEKMCELADLNNLILSKEAELAKIDREILSTIMSLPDGTERFVLIERYINRKSWRKIYDGLHYSRMQVNRIHRRGLDMIYPLINFEEVN